MQKLFNNLMALTVDGDVTKFYRKDVTTIQGTSMRIFGYNFASYTDWLKEDALESRGIMFEMDGDKPVRIASRPMEKYFNLGENPLTMDLDLTDIEFGMTKADGSLISTYVDKGILSTKSKMSISSDQAICALQVLLRHDRIDLYNRCLQLAEDGFTCNFEYVAPDNRVVLIYPERDLILLNVRHNDTGEYVALADLKRDTVLRKYLVDTFVLDPNVDPDEMIRDVRATEGIEGYVFRLNSGQMFKLKTEWYSSLHNLKDTLNNNRYLFECVAAGASDDIKSLFEDEWSIKKVNTFEQVFLNYLAVSSKICQDFYTKNMMLSRKDYAILAQNLLRELESFELFGVIMQLYGATDLDLNDMVDSIATVFVKNCEKHIPDEYILVK